MIIRQLEAALLQISTHSDTINNTSNCSNNWGGIHIQFDTFRFFTEFIPPNFIYFQSRDGEAYLGLGQADEVTLNASKTIFEERETLKQFQKKLRKENKHIRWMGGIPFETGKGVSDSSRPTFILPRVLLSIQKSGAKVFIQARNKEGFKDSLHAALEELASIKKTNRRKGSIPRIHRRENIPNFGEWQKNILSALQKIKNKTFQKTVLSRKVKLTVSHFYNLGELLTFFKHEPGFRFIASDKKGGHFFSTSPERLFKWERGHFQTEAIAGTKPREKEPQIDASLAQELMNSKKEAQEHQLVVDYLRESLGYNAKVGERQLLQLTHVQHLKTKVEVNSNMPPLKFLYTIHPTPALGGLPKAPALDFIHSHEKSDRVWFAAPLGYISAEKAEFLVAIRSLHIQENQVLLFSGCGIVLDSDPWMEWQELEKKITLFLKLFNTPTT